MSEKYLGQPESDLLKISMLDLLPRFNSSTIIGKPGQQKLFSAVKKKRRSGLRFLFG